MKNILIAGATGNLGSLIAQHLRQNKQANVFGIVRDAGSENALALQAQGVQLIVADLSNKADVEQATKNIDIVISALNGGPDVMLGGQLNLLEASVKNGVSRFVPSDYSVDYFKLDYGDNVNLDLRKKMYEAIRKSGIGYTIFLNGAFTEIFTSAFFDVIDVENGTVNFWGKGTENFDLTTMPDTAKYIASAVFDTATLNRVVAIAGEETTVNDVTKVLSKQTGKTFRQINNGSTETLKTLIDTIRAADPSNVRAYVFHQYKWPMFSGVGKLEAPIRQHYDGTAFTDLNTYLSAQ